MKNISRDLLSLRALLAVLCTFGCALAAACGGGSAGTGTGENLTTIEGRVLSPSGQPLPDVMVAVATADADPTDMTPPESKTSQTDPNGHFVIALPSDTLPETVQLDVSPPSQDSASVPVSAQPTDPSGIVVQVVVDEAAPPMTIQNTDVTVSIVGSCASSFDNNREIVQTAELPADTICTASVDLRENGLPRPGGHFRLETRACNDDAEWSTIGSGVTIDNGTSAVGLVDFTLVEDIDHCVYRVIAPVDEPGAEETAFEIRTLAKQTFDAVLAPVSTPTPDVTPTPVETPSPDVTPTPEPTGTPEITPTPASSPTPTADPGSDSTATPTPTPTPSGDTPSGRRL